MASGSRRGTLSSGPVRAAALEPAWLRFPVMRAPLAD
jgi:hypothetical protein